MGAAFSWMFGRGQLEQPVCALQRRSAGRAGRRTGQTENERCGPAPQAAALRPQGWHRHELVRCLAPSLVPLMPSNLVPLMRWPNTVGYMLEVCIPKIGRNQPTAQPPGLGSKSARIWSNHPTIGPNKVHSPEARPKSANRPKSNRSHPIIENLVETSPNLVSKSANSWPNRPKVSRNQPKVDRQPKFGRWCPKLGGHPTWCGNDTQCGIFDARPPGSTSSLGVVMAWEIRPRYHDGLCLFAGLHYDDRHGGEG